MARTLKLKHKYSSLWHLFFLGSTICALLLILISLISLIPQGDFHWKFEKNIHFLETINQNSVKSSLIRKLFLQSDSQENQLKPEQTLTKMDAFFLNRSRKSFRVKSQSFPLGYFTIEPSDQPRGNDPYFSLEQRVYKSKIKGTAERNLLLTNRKKLNFTHHLTKSECTNDVNLLIAFMTTPNEAERRRVIRSKFTSQLVQGFYVDNFYIKAKVLFFFGLPKSQTNNESKSLEALKQENDLYHDIVLTPEFIDTYGNLTLKVLSSLKYACERCSKATYFIKIDDDTIANIPEIIRAYLQPCNRDPSCAKLNFTMGHRYEKAAVARKGRWSVSYKNFPLETFPSYMFGGFYLIKGDVCNLWNAAFYFPILPVEDAFVTGVLGNAVNLKQISDHKRFAAQFFTHVGSISAKHFKMGFIYSATDLSLKSLTNFWHDYSLL